MAPKAFFEDVEDALVGFLPSTLRGFSSRRSGRNLKVWYGDADREHFEVQLLPASVAGDGQALEVGFHAEHGDVDRNEQVVAGLLAREQDWRADLGDPPEAGAFLGSAASWRRISEVWAEGTLVPEAAVDAAERLAVYIRVLEPLRRSGAA